MASCNECKLNARRASDGCDQVLLLFIIDILVFIP